MFTLTEEVFQPTKYIWIGTRERTLRTLLKVNSLILTKHVIDLERSMLILLEIKMHKPLHETTSKSR